MSDLPYMDILSKHLFYRFFSDMDAPSKLLHVIFTLVGILLSTRILTTLMFKHTLSALMQKNSSSSSSSRNAVREPPHLPYTIPYLGNAISFLAPYPGQFFDSVFESLPREVGCCTLLLGGRKLYLLSSAPAVQALFRARGPHRDQINQEVLERGFALEAGEADRFLSDKEGTERWNHEFLIKSERVNELTGEFSKVLRNVLRRTFDDDDDGKDDEITTNLYEWLRDKMFTASTTAFMGDTLLSMYPDFCADFFELDRHFLGFFFGLPRWTMVGAYNVRARILSKLTEWNEKMHLETKGRVMDPVNNVPWEPLLGSRANRARHQSYQDKKLSMQAIAGLDLGFLFGLSSNAIPATGWMLLHILDPNGDKTVLPRVLSELESARCADGTLDVPKLIALPLFTSIWQETLRLYADVLVTRFLPADLTLPLDERGERQILLRKNTLVFSPSWIAGHDPVWAAGGGDGASKGGAPADVFYADRFLRLDPDTGKSVFSTSDASRHLFPFGGGKTICPGRVFAKQEVFAAVAMVLLEFEFDVLGVVDEKGKEVSGFPKPRKSYGGSGTVVMGGDFRVRIRKRA